MSHYKPYPAYKQSGVEWLQKVPTHWEQVPLKWLFECLDGKRIPLNAEQRADIPGDTPYWGSGGVVGHISKFLFDEDLILLGEDGAPFFDKDRPVAYHVSGKSWINNHIHVLKPTKGIPNAWFVYYLNSVEYRLYIDGSTRDKLTQEDMKRIAFLVPHKAEVEQILCSLDRETTRIDALITKKTRFIELLREKRQALITHAVTKGLDPNVKMKDSGVEWLGEVPQHWVVSKLKNCLREQLSYGANEAAEQDDPENPRFIRITDLNDDGTLKSETFKSLPFDVAAPYLLSEGDILLARSGATVGKSFLYSESMGPSCFAGYLIRARLSPGKMLPKYFWYIANSDYYWDFISGSNIQSTIQNVSGEKYGNLWVTLPTIAEQENIIARLDCEWRRFATLINRTERSVELLKERRSALITAAVTGQIDLREAA